MLSFDFIDKAEQTERITKELLLSKNSQERYMEHYLGVHVCKGLFKSPLRSDKTPTCAFFKNSQGKLMMKDFGNGFCGDFVNVVMEKFGVSFVEALKIIANDFGIATYTHYTRNAPKIDYSNAVLEKTESANIRVEIQDFTDKQLRWWGDFGITADTLRKFRVFSCKNVFLNNAFFANYELGGPMYGYYGGKKDGAELWRIYRPGKRKYKFISNWTKYMLQGAHMLPETGDVLVISKALKDAMLLYEYGIPAVAPCSENQFLHENQIRALKKRFKHIVVFYDNDLAGISSMNKLKRKYPEFSYVWLPRGTCKDLSDYRKIYGPTKTEELINGCKQRLKEANA